MSDIIGGSVGIGLGVLAVVGIECVRFGIEEWRFRKWMREYMATHQAERAAWIAARPWLLPKP